MKTILEILGFEGKEYFANYGYRNEHCEAYKKLMMDLGTDSVYKYIAGRLDEIKYSRFNYHIVFISHDYIVLYDERDNGDTTSEGDCGYTVAKTEANLKIVDKLYNKRKDEEKRELEDLHTQWEDLKSLDNQEVRKRLLKDDYWNNTIYKENVIYIRDSRYRRDDNNKQYNLSDHDVKILSKYQDFYKLDIQELRNKIEKYTNGKLTIEDFNNIIKKIK